jgi:hypothetical protein
MDRKGKKLFKIISEKIAPKCAALSRKRRPEMIPRRLIKLFCLSILLFIILPFQSAKVVGKIQACNTMFVVFFRKEGKALIISSIIKSRRDVIIIISPVPGFQIAYRVSYNNSIPSGFDVVCAICPCFTAEPSSM